MNDLTFNQILKKFELSLRNGDTPQTMRFLTMLIEEADSEREEDIVNELGDLIATGEADEFEEFFDEVYATA